VAKISSDKVNWAKIFVGVLKLEVVSSKAEPESVSSIGESEVLSSIVDSVVDSVVDFVVDSVVDFFVVVAAKFF
jgi:hypothetical protein